MKEVILKGVIYQPKTPEAAIQLCNFINTLNNHNLKDEAQTLLNVHHARSNFLQAQAKKAKGGNPRIGAYTKSFRDAKKKALKLYREMTACPSANIFFSPTIILRYLRSECSCIT
ncbi:MAG: hypothetical protein ACI9TY_001401 [Alphaproteobacteria bacterium]|jgi:hypothetical protein